MISFEAARAKVIEVFSARVCTPERETLDLTAAPAAALGRILAESIIADRNYPPFNRSIRDGFALRAADASEPGAKLRLVAESRAGVAFDGTVGAGECVRILTGAPVPRGANAVVMHEYTREVGGFVVFEQAVRAGQYYVLAGAEARVGEVVVPRGTRLGYAELAMAAEVGRARIEVSRRPRVAILSTGDELVSLDQAPGPFQIRNSNNISLAAQVALTGGEPLTAGSAKDEIAELRARIERGLEADMLLLSGGVSVGKYDLVEQVLKDLGAEIFFDAVAIRPGKPVVFGWCRGKPVFGLPGNPVSTMVTFELFVVPAIEALSGCRLQPLPIFKAKLAHPVDEKGSVAHFLPARVSWPKGESDAEPKVEVLLWEGSGYRRRSPREFLSRCKHFETPTASRGMGGRSAAPWDLLTASKASSSLTCARNLAVARGVLVSERRSIPASALSHCNQVRQSDSGGSHEKTHRPIRIMFPVLSPCICST